MSAIVVTPEFGPTPLAVTLDATTSWDSDGEIVAYEWDFGDGSGALGATAATELLAIGCHEVTVAPRIGDAKPQFEFGAYRRCEAVGAAPIQYLTHWRMEKAKMGLRAPGRPMAEVAAGVGYQSEAAFNRAFRRYVGVGPGQYRTECHRTKTLPAVSSFRGT